MSGETFNYYYFGYLMVANIWRLAAVEPQVGYNLCVATLGGLAFSQMFAIARGLTGSVVFGYISGLLAMVIANLDAFFQYWSKGSIYHLDYWASTRVVGKGDTINEFPFFTVVHGDLHPHFIVFPVTILLLGLLLDPDRRRPFSEGTTLTENAVRLLSIAFVYGAAFTISLWELPVGGMMIFLLLQRDLPAWQPWSWPRIRIGLVSVGVLVVAYVLFLPFHLSFAAPDYGGVGFKVASTDLFEFLTVFGGLLLPGLVYLVAVTRPADKGGAAVAGDLASALAGASVLAVLIAYLMGNVVPLFLAMLIGLSLFATYRTDDPEQRAPVLLFLGAIVALFVCEFVYLKDPYGDRLYRMNTVFKLYLQAWILLAIASAWCLRQLAVLQGARRAPALLGISAFVAFALAGTAYPLSMSLTRMNFRPIPKTLDGNEYLAREHPDDFAAIEWLRENVDGMPVVLEASGNPYSYYARISSNVGIPTVMGWSNHEGLWRSHDPSVGQRQAHVRQIYAATTLSEVEPLLERYEVRYIVVGELERKDFPEPALQKFAALEEVFRQGGTVVYRRDA